MPTITTPFDQGPAPAFTLKDGTTTITYAYEFGGYHANYGPDGQPCYRFALRDIRGADTLLGSVVDVPAWNAYCDANGIPREPSIQSPPVPVVLSPSDAATVQAHPSIAATPDQPATHVVVEKSLWDRVKAALVDAKDAVEHVL